MKTESNIRPTQSVEFCKDTERNFVIFNDLNSIEEFERDEETMYRWNCYQFNTSASLENIMEHAEEYLTLVKEKEYNDLAEKIREKRNKLLAESDKMMCLDRLDLDTSSAIKFLASLKNIFANNWSYYRQALRDITNQPNFPYEVEWPEQPNE